LQLAVAVRASAVPTACGLGGLAASVALEQYGELDVSENERSAVAS
jgi:hypothetical protein